MCFIPMNIHNEQFNGVRQLRWQHITPVVSTLSTTNRLLSFFFIKHYILPPSLFLSFCGTPSRFHNLLVVFPGCLKMLMFSSCNSKFFPVKHIHYPVNLSSDHFHTDAVVPSSDHCRTETVLPPSEHYCIETVAQSVDHSCIDIAVPSSDHCCIETVPQSSEHHGTMELAPSSDHLHTKIT